MASGRGLELNSGMLCVKYMLVVISVMFALTAILLILVGTAIQAAFGDYRQFIDDSFWSPPALLIATGFIMLFVATLGTYGAIKESVMLTNVFGVFLFLVFILQVAASIAALIMEGQVGSMLVRTMNQSLAEYETNEYVQNGVDLMQTSLQCCGVFGPADWKPYWSPNQNMTDMNENEVIVPYSCCGEFSETNRMECEIQFQSGCQQRMKFIIGQSAMYIAVGAITVAFVQLLGALCAFMLAKTLRHNKSIREARRWQLQQSLGVLIAGGKVVPPMNSPITGYTQLERSERFADADPVTYSPNSPSVN